MAASGTGGFPRGTAARTSASGHDTFMRSVSEAGFAPVAPVHRVGATGAYRATTAGTAVGSGAGVGAGAGAGGITPGTNVNRGATVSSVDPLGTSTLVSSFTCCWPSASVPAVCVWNREPACGSHKRYHWALRRKAPQTHCA